MSTFLLACGSLRRELAEVLSRHEWLVEVEYLPPDLHMSPDRLAAAVDTRLDQVRGTYQRVVLIYGNCAPRLDEVLERHGAERLPGEHCFEIFGGDEFMPMLREEPGTYFLTDFLCHNFQRVVTGLGLDRFPSLKQTYFRNYTRAVYLDTGTYGGLETKAREIAGYLGLPLVISRVGITGLERRLCMVMDRTAHETTSPEGPAR